MIKKTRYEEPKMPESLRRLMDMEIDEVDRRQRSKRSSTQKDGYSQKNKTKKVGNYRTTEKNNYRTSQKPQRKEHKEIEGARGQSLRSDASRKQKADFNRSHTQNRDPRKLREEQNRNSRKVREEQNRNPRKIRDEENREYRRAREGQSRDAIKSREEQRRAYSQNRDPRKFSGEQKRENTRSSDVRRTGAEVKRREKVSGFDSRSSAKKSRQKYDAQPRKSSRKEGKLARFFQMIAHGLQVFFGFILRGGDKSRYITQERRSQLDFRFFRNISVLFVGVLVCMMIVITLNPDKKVSLAENRPLEQKPAFSIASYLDGKYASDQSKYLSDQFPNRSGFIKTKANFDRFIGKNEINGVYIGDQGYLMEGFKAANPTNTKAKADAINTFAAANPKIKVSVMLAPNKAEIYRNLLPKNAPVDSQVKYSDEFKSMLNKNIKYVSLFDSFNRVKNNEQLYFKTDHHWTVDGAFVAYNEYCKSMNLEPASKNAFTVSLASDSFYGSLYYKNGAQIGRPDNLFLYIQQGNFPVVTKYYDTKKKVPSLYDVSKLEGRDPYEVFTGGNHTQIKIRTNIDTERKLLIIKDSYANSMLPFLTNNFSEINVIDLRYFTGSLKDVLNNNTVTDVLILGNINTFNSDSSILNINE